MVVVGSFFRGASSLAGSLLLLHEMTAEVRQNE
jgi:hypothetical protein